MAAVTLDVRDVSKRFGSGDTAVVDVREVSLAVESGEVVLITDDGEEVLRAGDCAGFKAGVPNGHSVQNRSTAEAVLRYAGDFLPSWAGAISIDLMPAVLVLIFCVVQANIRREDEPLVAETMTAAQVIVALRLAREVEAAHMAANAAPLQPTAEENVTPLASARGKKD